MIKYKVNRGKVFSLNDDAFSERTPLSDYWAGFIAADGCITNRKTIQVNLQCKDIDHLMKLSEFLNSDAKPRMYDTCSRISFTSAKIVSDLEINYNITKQKSKTYNTDYISKQFLLGYFDGDGILTSYMDKGGQVMKGSIIGSYSFIENLADKLKAFSFSVSTRENIKIIQFPQTSTLVFLSWLYCNSDIYLQRKKELFQSIFQKLSDKRKRIYLKRIASFAEQGQLQVKDESVTDTLKDLANYSCLMAGYLHSKKT